MTKDLNREDYPFAFAFENLLFQARRKAFVDEDRIVSNREFSRMLNEFLSDHDRVHASGVEIGRWLKGKSVPSHELCKAIHSLFTDKFDLEFDFDVLWAFAVFQYMTPDHVRGLVKWIDLKSSG